MHEKCDFNEKEGYLGLTFTWGQKPLKIWGRKQQQKNLDWIGRGEKVRKSLKKYEEHMRKDFLKHLQTKIRLVDNKLWLIEEQIWSIQASIEH